MSETVMDEKLRLANLTIWDANLKIDSLNKKISKLETALGKEQSHANGTPIDREELLQMNGEPVWCVDGDEHQAWCLVDVVDMTPNAIDKETGLWDGNFYDMRGADKKLHPLGWIAYRRKENHDAI